MGHFKRPMHRYLSMRWLSCWAILLVTSFLMHPGASASASELVIYSGRKESAIKPVVELFERETGIKVALKVGKTSGLANEIIQERGRPRADIFIATEAGVARSLRGKDFCSRMLLQALGRYRPSTRASAGSGPASPAAPG